MSFTEGCTCSVAVNHVTSVAVNHVTSVAVNHVTSVAVNHVNREQRQGSRSCINCSRPSGSHPQDVAAVAFGNNRCAAAVNQV